MNNSAAILSEKWIGDTYKLNVIYGVWPEDSGMYTITCPYQLRDEIIKMQNFMVDKQKEYDALARYVGGKSDILKELEQQYEFMEEIDK